MQIPIILSILLLVRIDALDVECTVFVDQSVQNGFSDGSREHPFSTIGEAQTFIRSTSANANTSSRYTSKVVCIFGGIYRESLAFTAEDSGTADAPTIYTALPGQNVSISGAVPISFEPLPPHDPARYFLPPSVVSSVFVSDLSAAGISDVSDLNTWWPRGFSNGGCQKSAPLELIFNGEPQTVARWPNVDAVDGSGPGWALTEHTDGTLTNNSFFATANASFLGFRDTENMILFGFWFWEWADALVYPVLPFPAPVNDSPVLVNFSLSRGGGGGVLQAGDGARYFAQNSLDALDAPGEYYVNTSSAMLYFYPPGGTLPQGAEVTVNTSERVGVVKDVAVPCLILGRMDYSCLFLQRCCQAMGQATYGSSELLLSLAAATVLIGSLVMDSFSST